LLTTTPNNHINAIDIDLKFGELGDIVRWCQHNTIEDWWYEIASIAGDAPGNYKFYFNNERDYINFILWKK
jgi:hypothetical protein